MASEPIQPNNDDDVDTRAEGLYTVRELSPEEIRRAHVSDEDITIVARQNSSEEFLAFLDSLDVISDVSSAS